MIGAVVLDGGNSYAPESHALYTAMLRATNQNAPSMVVIPVASIENPRKAVRRAEGFFKVIGFHTEHIMDTNAETANEPLASAPIENINAVYLTDGNPAHAAESLANSEALNRLRHAWQNTG